jgi:thiamine biosynthesis lipoprotein ApbE
MNMKMKFLLIASIVVSFMRLVPSPAFADTYRTSHEHVLGTSMEWIVEADNEQLAMQSETIVLEEICRLDAIFSRYRSDSVLNQWTQGVLREKQLPSELVEVLQFAEQMRVESDGAFNIRVTRLEKLWKDAVTSQRSPTAGERQLIINALRQPMMEYDNQDLAEYGVTLDAVAKGYILDRVCERVQRELPQLSGMCINIGGDLRQAGEIAVEMRIENPFSASVGSKPIEAWVNEGPKGVATSGGYRRYQMLKDSRISHILDPRTGLPADSLASVTVIAPTGMEADAYATIVAVLGAEAGLQWIESRTDAACLVVDHSGTIHRSTKWPNGRAETQNSHSTVKLVSNIDTKPKPGLHVDFTLAKVGGGGYRRPYVAVWLEDEESFPVKTAVLWIQTEQPGPRWHRDLTRWYRNDRIRKLSEKVDMIETIAGATRGPGEYSAHFDGTDNTGKPLKPGKYTLFLEVARENGTYQLLKQSIQWNDEEFAIQDWGSNVEVAKASIRFIPSKSEN